MGSSYRKPMTIETLRSDSLTPIGSLSGWWREYVTADASWVGTPCIQHRPLTELTDVRQPLKGVSIVRGYLVISHTDVHRRISAVNASKAIFLIFCMVLCRLAFSIWYKELDTRVLQKYVDINIQRNKSSKTKIECIGLDNTVLFRVKYNIE